MNARTQKWLYGLGSAALGGGASAITSGFTAVGFAPDKFNVQDFQGTLHLLGLMLANFIISGVFSAAFYLRQSPLPAESTGDTETTNKSTNPKP
jgi:hypothetical protein